LGDIEDVFDTGWTPGHFGTVTYGTWQNYTCTEMPARSGCERRTA
jgi:hypothetical protein